MARIQSVPAQPVAPPEGPRRLGPRPLPLHLLAASLAWMNSRAVWPRLSDGSLLWKPDLQDAAEDLRRRLESVDPGSFARALDQQIHRRHRALVDGILAYRRHPYRREMPAPPEIWRAGTTRLLDYGAAGASTAAGAGKPIPILVVPSLINRAYILDLTRESSLLRWLAGQGFRPYLVDWDRPGPEERRFTLTDYVCDRLEAALDTVVRERGARPVVMGYCMGGLLALGLALRRQEDISALALLATPWDFHAGGDARDRLAASALRAFSPLIDAMGELPVDAIQTLFAALDPQLVARKFVSFARLDPASSRAAAFVALEDWLNDGTGLAAPVARECLGGWYADNTPAEGQWRLAGRVVDPGRLDLPCLCVIPDRDRIVPPASAQALAVPGAHGLKVGLGHVGMIVGHRAPARVWEPVAAWLRERARGQG